MQILEADDEDDETILDEIMREDDDEYESKKSFPIEMMKKEK